MVKTLVVIQCRYRSTRLPGKALYPVAGIPMVVFLMKRLKGGLPEDAFRIVLATSKNSSDHVINVWGDFERIPVIRSVENDVIRRYIDVLARYPADTVVRVTADNPLTCPEILQRLVLEKMQSDDEYVDCENLPVGCATDVFSKEVLLRLDASATAADEREHINLHILRHEDRFRISRHRIDGAPKRPDLRMTIDTLEDWRRVNRIFGTDENEPWKISLSEVVERMDRLSV